MSNGWGPEEQYQYWRDAALAGEIRQDGYRLVIERKPGRPTDHLHGFARCSIMVGNGLVGTITLRAQSAGVVASGHVVADRVLYILDSAVRSVDADWEDCVPVAALLMSGAKEFPADWAVRKSDFPW